MSEPLWRQSSFHVSKQMTNDKICSLEDDNRYKRWKMQKMATAIKCYHDSFTDNALPLVHLIRIKAQCEKSTSCPYQRGWCLASIQVLVSNNKSASSSLKQFIFFLKKTRFNLRCLDDQVRYVFEKSAGDPKWKFILPINNQWLNCLYVACHFFHNTQLLLNGYK